MKPETIKFAAGFCVIFAAVCIMMPALLSYALRLANLIVIVLVAAVVSFALVSVKQRIKKKPSPDEPVLPPPIEKI